MSDLRDEQPPSDSPAVTPKRDSRSVMQFVRGALVGVIVVAFLQCGLLVIMLSAKGYASGSHRTPGALAFWVDVALLLLLGGLAIRAKGKAFRNGAMSGAALALLLSAACWGSSGLGF
jgi:hypothetical protein